MNSLEEEYKKHLIIKPPSNDEIIQQKFVYVIDSRDRNLAKYPTPSTYQLQLEEDVTDVISIQLIHADVPMPRYLVHSHNRSIHFRETLDPEGPIKEALLSMGDYSTAEELRAEIQTQLSAVSAASGGVVVTLDPRLQKLTFQTSLQDSGGNPLPFVILTEGDPRPYGPQSIEKIPKTDSTTGLWLYGPDGKRITEQVRFGQSTSTYRKGTIAKVVGFANATYSTQLPSGGTVYTTDGISTTLHGVGTAFQTDGVQVGQRLLLDVSGALTGPWEVAAVVSETELSLTAAPGLLALTAEGTGPGVVHLDRLVAPYRVDLHGDHYLVMKMKRVKNLYSTGDGVNQSFTIIPKPGGVNQWNVQSWSFDTIKYFHPILPDLRRLEISFYDRDGNLYDFQNQDHTLQVVFQTYKQGRHYKDLFRAE